MAVPILIIVLSTTLPARVDRTVNLVVASLYVPVSMYTAAGESWTYYHAFAVGLEVLLLAFVLRCAWTWPCTSSASMPDVATSPHRPHMQTER